MDIESKNKNCGNCHFWVKILDPEIIGPTDNGFCRRHAPSPSEANPSLSEKDRRGEDLWNLIGPTYWPITLRSVWCGEWKLKEA